ncbi:MAG: hypothetical protein R3350_03215 [Saprospiraceae bacterium]|nr:hypothetical protein [Saprospiraceae bacterium]
MKCNNLPFFPGPILMIILLALPFTGHSGIVVTNGLSQIRQLNPGEVYQGNISVTNTEDSPQTVNLYMSDYTFQHTGETQYPAPGTLERSNAGWITLESDFVTLQPQEERNIFYEIRVPEEPLIGTYWSVIMLEGVPEINPEEVLERGVTVQTRVRYAVQIATHINSSGSRELVFEGLDLQEDKESNVLMVVVKNTGERMLDPFLSLEIFNSMGASEKVVKAERRKIYPGTSRKFVLPLENVVPGVYQAVLLADSNQEDVFGANIELDLMKKKD